MDLALDKIKTGIQTSVLHPRRRVVGPLLLVEEAGLAPASLPELVLMPIFCF